MDSSGSIKSDLLRDIVSGKLSLDDINIEDAIILGLKPALGTGNEFTNLFNENMSQEQKCQLMRKWMSLNEGFLTIVKDHVSQPEKYDLLTVQDFHGYLHAEEQRWAFAGFCRTVNHITKYATNGTDDTLRWIFDHVPLELTKELSIVMHRCLTLLTEIRGKTAQDNSHLTVVRQAAEHCIALNAGKIALFDE
jgi:hypothetical protein